MGNVFIVASFKGLFHKNSNIFICFQVFSRIKNSGLKSHFKPPKLEFLLFQYQQFVKIYRHHKGAKLFRRLYA